MCATCGIFAAAGSYVIVSPALWTAAGTQYWLMTMRRSLSSLCPTMISPVAETFFPTTTVEQAEASTAIPATAVATAATNI